MKIFLILSALIILATSSMAIKEDICALPHSQDGHKGVTCYGHFPSWSYNAAVNECVEFIYGGCLGNSNRFKSKEACEEKCKE